MTAFTITEKQDPKTCQHEHTFVLEGDVWCEECETNLGPARPTIAQLEADVTKLEQEYDRVKALHSDGPHSEYCLSCRSRYEHGHEPTCEREEYVTKPTLLNQIGVELQWAREQVALAKQDAHLAQCDVDRKAATDALMELARSQKPLYRIAGSSWAGFEVEIMFVEGQWATVACIKRNGKEITGGATFGKMYRVRKQYVIGLL